MRTMKRQAAGITALLMMALALSVLFAPAAMAATAFVWNTPVNGIAGGSQYTNTLPGSATYTSATINNISPASSGVSVSGVNTGTLTINVPSNYAGTFRVDAADSGNTYTSIFEIAPTASQANKSYSLEGSSVNFPVTDLFTSPIPSGISEIKITNVTGGSSEGELKAISGGIGIPVSAGVVCSRLVYTRLSSAPAMQNDEIFTIYYALTVNGVDSAQLTSIVTIKKPGSLYAKPITLDTYIGASASNLFGASNWQGSPAWISITQGLSPNYGELRNGSDYVVLGKEYTGLGSFTYTPPDNWTGKVTLKYRIGNTDYSESDENTITINILPRANNDSYVVPMNSTYETKSTEYLLSNDKYYGGVTLAIASNPSHGSITDFNTTTGYFKYTPQLGYNGTDTFTYTIKDGSGLTSAAATVSLRVGGSNYQAVVDSGGLSVSVTNGLLASYPSGYSVRSNASTSSYFTLYSNGSFTFIPPAGQSGLFTLQYDLVDPSGVATAQSVTVAVRPRGVNTTYDTANNITFSLSSADARKVNLGSNLRATVTGNPTYGTLNMLTDGTFTYVPNAGFVGTDSFRYRLTDTVANLDSDEVTVTIRVAAASLLPDDPLIPTLPPTGTSEAIDWALICLGAAVVLGGLYAIYVARKRMSKKE